MQYNNINISIVLPCFNEGYTIYKNIERIYDFLVLKGMNYEIIAVNDGSWDNTLDELERINQKIPLAIISYTRNKGKGYAVKKGILASKNEIILFLDADLGIPIEELEKFLEEII